MKRRNFFSKIGKCLLGIGIIKALPTPEVETVPPAPQNIRATAETNGILGWTVPEQTPVGMVEIGNELYIVEPADSNKASVDIDHKHTVTGLESGKEYIFRVRPGESK